ncbi:MAG: radical SAM protein [Desulfarculus sp.]|nr:radical SAM protein [Desulfarculus sp.]
MTTDNPFACKPNEIKIEVTSACNLACSFCYKGEYVDAPARQAPEDQVLDWIDWAVDNQVPGVRFTGGEPTMHPAIKLFCNYAHLRGRRITLNTNGVSLASLYADLLRVVDGFCLSLPTLDAAKMDEICGRRGVLEKKLAFLRQAVAQFRPVNLLTALLPETKSHLEEFLLLARQYPGVRWRPLRLKATPEQPRPWTRKDAQDFAQEVAALMDRYPEDVGGINLAAPFCAVEPMDLGARVFGGRVANCGPYHSLVVDLDGRLRSCYGVRDPLATEPTTLAEVLGSQSLRNCAEPASLPDHCQACPHVGRCAGGCRNWSGLVEHQGKWVDYLAGFLPRA